jgi:HTH-type transcriptional regulator/antitoxin HipB
MQFSVRFYYDADGNRPIISFLEDLRKQDSILHKLVVAGIKKLEMSERHGPPLTELVDQKHDIFELRIGDKNIATFSKEEQQEYIAAETALDLASILYQIRQERGLTQRQAAARTGLKQQAISRLEKAASNIQLGTLQRYLGALGYHLEISVIDNRTGDIAGTSSLAHLERIKSV